MGEESDWIDISVPLKNGMVRYPGDPPVDIYRNCPKNPKEPMVSSLSMSVHGGTHVDAPLHYLVDGNSIDRMPAGAMIGPARVIGITDPHVISVQELEGQHISPGERILFKTRNSSLWGFDFFVEDYVYLSTQGASFLVERNVLAVGVDYLSLGGFNRNESDVHRMLLGAGIWIVEGLNLSRVEPGWYDLVCTPLMITGAEAAPARALIRPRRSTDLQRG